MNGTSLSSLSIRNVSKLLRQKELTATYLCQQCLNIANKTRYLNAFITINDERALEEAQTFDNDLTTLEKAEDTSNNILNGIPIAIKDNFCTKDILTSCGSRMLANYYPPYDATIVDKLCNKSGAIMLGKTNLDEFAMGSSSVTSYYGPAANPWKSFGQAHFSSSNGAGSRQEPSSKTASLGQHDYNQPDSWYMAGGSSTGSAVAVATGSVFAAIGTDTGGSNRHPASMVGVVGFKPSYGIISRFGLVPLAHSLDTVSMLARQVDDIQVIFEHIVGSDENDLTAMDLDNKIPYNMSDNSYIDQQYMNLLENNHADSKFKKIVIGIPDEFSLCGELSSEVSSLWESVIKNLSINFSSIFDIVRITTPNIVHSTECYTILSSCELASNMSCYDGVKYGFSDRSKLSSSSHKSFDRDAWYKSNRDQGFGLEVKKRILSGNYFLHGDNVQKYYFQALKVRRLICQDFAKVFHNDSTNRSVDIILVPSTPTTATSNSEWLRKQDDNKLFAEDYCLIPANLAGLPSITLPVALSKDGLPIGLQLIASQFEDRKLLSISKLFEKHIFQYDHHLTYTESN